jgi:hypothetical protein
MTTDAAGATSQPSTVDQPVVTAARVPLASSQPTLIGATRTPLTVLGATDVGFCEGDSCVIPGPAGGSAEN